MRILVGAFSRSSLGHVIRSARLAAHLVKRGHEVIFCCAEEAQHYPRALGLQVALVPELTPLGPWKTWRTDDELRQATKTRMASPKFLADCIAVERPIIETFRPDVIVADLRNTMCVLGALSGIPVINLTNMKLLTFPMPIVYPCVVESLLEIGVPSAAANKVLGDVIVIPGFSSHEPLSDIAPGIWSLAHEGVREIRHVGPILPSYGETRGAPPAHGSIYFSLGGAMSVATDLVKLLEKVRGRPERFIVHRGEHLSEESMLSALDGRSDVSSFDYRPDCASLMAGASVSVIHGGHGTIYDTIGAGRPALVTPNNAEQKGNGRLLEKLGMALVLEPGASAEELNAALDRLRNERSFSEAAERARQRIQGANGLDNIALLIESGVM